MGHLIFWRMDLKFPPLFTKLVLTCAVGYCIYEEEDILVMNNEPISGRWGRATTRKFGRWEGLLECNNNLEADPLNLQARQYVTTAHTWSWKASNIILDEWKSRSWKNNPYSLPWNEPTFPHLNAFTTQVYITFCSTLQGQWGGWDGQLRNQEPVTGYFFKLKSFINFFFLFCFSSNHKTPPSSDSSRCERLHKCNCNTWPWGSQEVHFHHFPFHCCQTRMVIACHYDSLLKPEGFLGATDSAVPCAQWEQD